MQNDYVIERMIREHDEYARAVAELEGLRRRAMAEGRASRLAAWRERLGRVVGRRATHVPAGQF